MKKNTTKIIALSMLIALFMGSSISPTIAQITITAADLPEIGTMVIRDVDTLNITSPGGAGLDQTWDFSAAEAAFSDTLIYYSPSEVPGGSSFETATVAAGRLITSPTGDIYTFAFYELANDGLYSLGWNMNVESELFTIRTIQTYDPAPNTLTLPLTYGFTTELASTGHLYIGTSVFGFTDSTYTKSELTATQLVDGSGSIITPIGTYDALRMVETSTSIDSLFQWNATAEEFEFSQVDTVEAVTYHWIANEIGEVATYYEDVDSVYFQYFRASEVTGVVKRDLNNNLRLYPNPVSNTLLVQSDGLVESIEVYSISGQVVPVTRRNMTIDTSSLKPGLYICRVVTKNGFSTQKFLKE